MSLFEQWEKYNKKHPKVIHLIKSGNMIHVYNEDAMILSRVFGYRVTLAGGSGVPYLKASFSKEAVNKVMSIMKDKRKFMSFLYEKDQDGIYKKIKEVTFSHSYNKQDFMDDAYIQTEIQHIINTEEAKNTKLQHQGLNQLKDERFTLHHKAYKLSFWFNSSVSKYMPAIFRNSYGTQLINAWTQTMSYINELRNISASTKENIEKYSLVKNSIYFKLSTQIDTLKDIVRAIGSIKGWKNKRHFYFIALRVDEIGKIIWGLKRQLIANTQEQKRYAI